MSLLELRDLRARIIAWSGVVAGIVYMLPPNIKESRMVSSNLRCLE
jgi:hypothetical protein